MQIKQTVLQQSIMEMLRLSGRAQDNVFDSRAQGTLNWAISPQDMALVSKIAERGVEMGAACKVTVDAQLAMMDVACVHCNGTPLKLLQMLMASPDDFSHDFVGIMRHVNRKTGQLMGDFKPRFRAE